MQLTGSDTSKLWDGIWDLEESQFSRDPSEKEVRFFRVLVEGGPQTPWLTGIILKCMYSDDGIRGWVVFTVCFVGFVFVLIPVETTPFLHCFNTGKFSGPT